MKYDRIEEVNKNIDTIEHIEKFNPYHDSRGRFTTAGGGGGAATGPSRGTATGSSGGIKEPPANASKAEWKKYALKVFKEVDKVEAEYNKLGDKWSEAYDEVSRCRRAGDTKGEAKAQKKADALSDKLIDMENKVWEARGKRNQVEDEAYERGIVLA